MSEKRKRDRNAPSDVDTVQEQQEVTELLESGAYIPPFKLAKLVANQNGDQSSQQHQRLTWEALRVNAFCCV